LYTLQKVAYGAFWATTGMEKVLKTTEDSRALKQRYADLEWSWNLRV
jgi:phosphoribosyl-dephospho-CoA transferase